MGSAAECHWLRQCFLSSAIGSALHWQSQWHTNSRRLRLGVKRGCVRKCQQIFLLFIAKPKRSTVGLSRRSRRLRAWKKMLTLIPKHKGTEHLQADLKTRLKEARAQAQSEKSSPEKGRSFRIPRQGAGTVVLIGAPNSGRSRIVAELTNAEPEVAVYPFTTREPFPAMMPCGGALVQLIDTPPIAEGHMEPYLINYVRSRPIWCCCALTGRAMTLQTKLWPCWSSLKNGRRCWPRRPASMRKTSAGFESARGSC